MDIETNTLYCSRRFGTELTNYTFQHSHKYSMMESEEIEPSVHGPLASYLTHIQDYTHQQAQLTPHTHNYFQYQQQITPHMREVLVGWMVGVHRCMRLKEETLMMGVYLMDSYCVKRQVQKQNYQLLGVTTLFIAAKYHEITIPKLSSFVRVCEDFYSAGKVLEMEGLILNAFDFQLSSFVLPHELVLNRLAVLLEHEDPSTKATIEKVCMYLLNLTLLDHSFTHLQPSYLSAAIIYMGGKMKDTQYINSKIILNTYKLQTSIFRNYFNQLITLYSRKNERKFAEISKKFKVVERCSYSHLY